MHILKLPSSPSHEELLSLFLYFTIEQKEMADESIFNPYGHAVRVKLSCLMNKIIRFIQIDSVHVVIKNR